MLHRYALHAFTRTVDDYEYNISIDTVRVPVAYRTVLVQYCRRPDCGGSVGTVVL